MNYTIFTWRDHWTDTRHYAFILPCFRYFSAPSSLWRGSTIDSHEEHHRYNVHPVPGAGVTSHTTWSYLLGQERSVVFHLPLLFLPLILLHPLDEGSSVRNWTILHLLSHNFGLKPTGLILVITSSGTWPSTPASSHLFQRQHHSARYLGLDSQVQTH